MNKATRTPATSKTRRERAVVVHLGCGGVDEDSLEELRLLAGSAGARVCATVTGARRVPHPATFVGSGKAREVADAVAAQRADLVLVNHPVTPIQERNLERIVRCRVVDRTSLILDIFAQRASSHEGKLQVELAQLRHLATRLVRGWSHLERQKGGIGLRGPGETQLETDRRLIGNRIRTLKSRLHKVRQQRTQRRRARRRVPLPAVSLVGYTNAGKSSLFNQLTDSAVLVEDRLFATLDPTMRRLALPDFGRVILADTVGFIRHLPHNLVEAFQSTLEEVSQAALLVHVIDASDVEHEEHAEQVRVVLGDIDAGQVPTITAYNKIDRIGQPASFRRGADGRIDRVWLSARTGDGVPFLLRAMSDFFRSQRVPRRVMLARDRAELRARIYARACVHREEYSETAGWILEAEFNPADLSWLERQSGVELDPGAEPPALARTGSAP